MLACVVFLWGQKLGPLLPTFFWEGSPTDYRKKGTLILGSALEDLESVGSGSAMSDRMVLAGCFQRFESPLHPTPARHSHSSACFEGTPFSLV